MNYKQLAEKLQIKKLVPGHRSCSGCGFPQIVRAVLASSDKPVVVGCATGCLEVTSTIYPFSSWNVPFIHSAFENAAATIAGVESAYKSLKKQGKIESDINFVAFGGDGGSFDIGLQSLSGALERAHDFLYVCYDNEAYMNCLSLDSFIMAEKGLTRITEIKAGDKVYAFNQKNGNLVLKKCTGLFDNGIKEVYELNTLHHTIKATPNHPFLVVERRGIKGQNRLIWKQLDELNNSDEVLVLKKLQNEHSYRFPPIKLSKKGDYKVNKIKQRNFLADNEYFSSERIISIKLIKKEPTLDLRVEGEHNFIADGIVVHNTGIQRSSATPYGASTTTTPAGKILHGKEEFRKDFARICIAHNTPYVAQASLSNLIDLTNKAQKAFSIKGPKVLLVLQPCTLGWQFPPDKTIEIAKLAVETRFWPLYEVENGKYKLTYKPSKNIPVVEYLKTQGRFKHLFKPENKHIIDLIQKNIDEEWERLLNAIKNSP